MLMAVQLYAFIEISEVYILHGCTALLKLLILSIINYATVSYLVRLLHTHAKDLLISHALEFLNVTHILEWIPVRNTVRTIYHTVLSGCRPH